MNADRVNRWLTLAANIGVLTGIVLLIIELDQNQDMMRSQTRSQISQEESAFALQTAYSEDMAELVLRSLKGEQLEGVASHQLAWRSVGWLKIQENIHYQAQNGLFGESEYAGIRSQWKQFIKLNPQLAGTWCVWRNNFSVEFRRDFQSGFDELDCPAG